MLQLRRAAGFPPQTTMRGYMRLLGSTGILVRRRQSEFPGNVDVELAEPGRDLLEVIGAMRVWLATAPEGPIELGSTAAKGVVKTMVEAWASNIMRALAARPLSLTELDSVISALSYPSLERRLAAMRVAGQVQKVSARRGSTPYTVTDWLRRAVAPLVAAIRWERAHLRERTVPISPRDVEAAFLLSVPLLSIEDGLSGSCRMAVELRNRNRSSFAGVMVNIEEGRLAHCSSRLSGSSDCFAVGNVRVWLTAMCDGRLDELEIGGDSKVAGRLVKGLHRILFGEIREVVVA